MPVHNIQESFREPQDVSRSGDAQVGQQDFVELAQRSVDEGREALRGELQLEFGGKEQK